MPPRHHAPAPVIVPEPPRPRSKAENVIRTIILIPVVLVCGVIAYVLLHSVFLSFVRPIGPFMDGFNGMMKDINANPEVANGLVGPVLAYLLFAAVVYGIASLFHIRTGWKIALALIFPIALLIYSLFPKWTHVGGGWYKRSY